MAKLRTPLLPKQVARLRGIVDYYIQRGVPIVRAWPKKGRRVQTPAERTAQCWLITASRRYSCNPGWLTRQMQARLNGYSWTSRDYFMSHYLNPIGGNELPGQGHHPPQPPLCPYGPVHYFHLVDSYAIETGVFTKTLYFRFSQDLRYELQFVRRHPRTIDYEQRRQGVVCVSAPLAPLLPEGLGHITLPEGTNNLYALSFLQVPGVTDTGFWYAYIRGFRKYDNHPAISITPWFRWYIPPRDEFTQPRAATALELLPNVDNAFAPAEEDIREPRSTTEFEKCFQPS